MRPFSFVPAGSSSSLWRIRIARSSFFPVRRTELGSCVKYHKLSFCQHFKFYWRGCAILAHPCAFVIRARHNAFWSVLQNNGRSGWSNTNEPGPGVFDDRTFGGRGDYRDINWLGVAGAIARKTEIQSNSLSEQFAPGWSGAFGLCE